jgi:hypothetical protein
MAEAGGDAAAASPEDEDEGAEAGNAPWAEAAD